MQKVGVLHVRPGRSSPAHKVSARRRSSVHRSSLAADARAEATYDDASAVLAEAKQIQSHLVAQDEALGRLLAEVRALKAAG